MNTIQHNNNFRKKPLNFTKLYCVIVLYCVVGFFLFFLICSKSNTIQYSSITKYNFCIKTLNFYKIVLCYCVVLCCCIFSDFFLIVPKPTQYNTIKQYNFCIKTLNFTKLYCVIVLLVFFFFFKLFRKQHNTIIKYNFCKKP